MLVEKCNQTEITTILHEICQQIWNPRYFLIFNDLKKNYKYLSYGMAIQLPVGLCQKREELFIRWLFFCMLCYIVYINMPVWADMHDGIIEGLLIAMFIPYLPVLRMKSY